ncbi:MAG: type II toxin-antitoxin system Phd/YefM family antitoxin [Leptospirillia bacterium]
MIFGSLAKRKGFPMEQLNIAEAKAHFSEIIRKALRGEEIVIAKNSKPLLKLVPIQSPQSDRVPGSAKTLILSLSPDFESTPSDFHEYV